MLIKQVHVNLKYNYYNIKIGSKIFNFQNIFSSLCDGDKIVLITNCMISKIWKKMVLNALIKNNIIVDEFIFPDGEQYKSLFSAEQLLSYLLKKNYDRNITLIALGGGVIGDLTGFVASIYQRGIKFIQIPTTLLSQVDAAIGGKTGVNHILGKNMIGSFWQPSLVISNIDFLSTLSYNQLLSGIAEVIKYAISFDNIFFIWLEKNIYKILSLDLNSTIYCIEKCCELKSQIICLDERESYSRMYLNLGHTFGHAIESYFQYDKYLHGEAIAIGMVVAITISYKLGLLNYQKYKKMINLIKYSGLPILFPKKIVLSSFFSYMYRDKKNISNKIRLILPIDIGKVKIFSNIDKKIIIASIKDCYY